MGSGASKKSNAEDKSNFEEDDEEDFDTFSKKKAGNKPKLEQNGLLPKLEASPAKKAKGRNSIVGLEDEEDDFQPLRKPKKKDEEKELRNEIIELEKTFENLDLDSSIKKPKPMMTRGLYRSSTIDDSFSTRPARGSRPPLGPFGTPAPKPLKFSWEESKPAPVVDKDNDDWNYKQTVIDGFDPDKFRKVNKDSKKDSGIRVERQFGSASSSESLGIERSNNNHYQNAFEMPGVPSYDNSEKQLLASLEQELGVL